MADSPLEYAAPLGGRRASTQRTRQWPWRLALAILCSWPAAGVHAARSCAEWSAALTSVEGTVEVRSASAPEWRAAVSGDRVCTGDSVRAEAASRATLLLPDESTIRVAEHSVLVLPEPPAGDGTLIELLRGLIHVISRDPRSLTFKTPFANAGLEGTEFDIRVDEAERRTDVAVLEGQVSLTTADAALLVESGYLAIARQGDAPTAEPIAAPIELMRWASYYVPIISDALPPADRAPSPGEQQDAEFFALRAAALLETGRVDAAQADLTTALRLQPGNVTALALRGVLELAHGNRANAQRAVDAALAANAASVVALIASSRLQSAAGDLAGADATLGRALALEPDNWIALTHRAELALARGNAGAAIEQASRARALAPSSAAPLVVLGFAELSGRETDAAGVTFERAASLEPGAPLPRVGLALTATQRGDIAEGRRQLELAVTNDPANALARSYMAKLYDAEHRNELTTTQIELAKDFDPGDSTPWLYSALQQLRANRVIGAMRDLSAAAERNGGRAVFRSRLLVDQDLATRSAALGRVYTEAGFGRLALVDAWQAVVDSPEEYASHRLLADLYAFEPRHEIARVSELFVSQLLQPINVTPVKPQLGQPGSFLAQRAGPSSMAFDEFTSPVAANGLKLFTSSALGDNGTRGTEVAAAGLTDRVAYGAGHYQFETDGFRENNQFEQRISNAFVQFQPSHALNLQAELRSTRAEHGDLTMLFDPSRYSATLRRTEEYDSLRLGAKRQLSSADALLASLTYQEGVTMARVGSTFGVDADDRGYSVDVQYQRRLAAARLQSGISYTSQRATRLTTITAPGFPDPFVTMEAIDKRQVGLYGYAHWSLRPTLTLTVGASFDRVEDMFADEDSVTPKIGLIWRPTARTTLRAAAFRTVFGSLTTSAQNPQPRLEPMQLAGFTQLVSVATADVAELRGLGIDHRLSERLFMGWEANSRETERPFVNLLVPGGGIERVDVGEREQRGYLYWTPGDRVSFSARLEKGRYSNEPLPMFGFSRMDIERLPLEVRYFAPTGITFGMRASRVEQHGMFESLPATPFDPPMFTPGSDRFVTVDAFVSYRLPKRRGSLALSADNLLDERFSFQDIDSMNPSLFPERLVSFRFTLAFD